ncbi:SMI1/KNR4 family protein [Streptomyces griseomycini]|uniref:Cell wall assembly regulator SMI1 n=1 Tax=Streptomyces griseomycini TaxID=66895 RepID=A0A7W7M0S1_9ACTN|nr:SMI1/KNR4 family protein [Streptomyces griseomycini]MBB4899236.1 cell wall assembly regulator SMI1 [Streptomyces griseomycini]GGR34959.1 SMI1/KNR4 family protein [Streptomyces griseomycini]
MNEPTSAPSPPALNSFGTWAPLLRAWADGIGAGNEDGAVYMAGAVGREGWRSSSGFRPRGRASAAEREAVERVRDALVAVGAESVTFSARVAPSGRTRLRVMSPGPAVESGPADGGTLLLVEGAVPEPWRRLPDPTPAARPAPSADPAALERRLRQRLPGAIGAGDEEIAAAEARLGLTLPDELKALYRVVRGRWEDREQDPRERDAVYDTVGCELVALDDLYVADPASRPAPWRFAACEAAVTPPDAAVQGLVGSPGWIVFGDNGGGDRIAVDLTPGPAGHTGQIVLIDHEAFTGAELIADSLTDLVRRTKPRGRQRGRSRDRGERPAVAHVNAAHLRSAEAAAHPDLEVLRIGVWDDPPVDLTPVIGLPRLRTLTAYPGTLADPRQIGRLTGLEYLEVGPAEWRTLLDAKAVPRGLAAAGISTHGLRDHGQLTDLSNDILALWGRPPIVRTVIDGDLGPLPPA